MELVTIVIESIKTFLLNGGVCLGTLAVIIMVMLIEDSIQRGRRKASRRENE